MRLDGSNGASDLQRFPPRAARLDLAQPALHATMLLCLTPPTAMGQVLRDQDAHAAERERAVQSLRSNELDKGRSCRRVRLCPMLFAAQTPSSQRNSCLGSPV